jgi:spore germination protein KB
MQLEKGEISNTELMFLVLSFLQGMLLTINFSYAISKYATWLAVLVGFIITLLFVLLYLQIALKFPGKNLVQINDIVFGPYVGKLFSASYIYFFFEYMIHYMYFFNSFWITYIMPETPRIAFLVMLVFVSGMAVRSGIEVIARCSFTFVVLVTLSLMTVTILLIPDMKPSNLLPLFEIKPMKFIQSVHIILAIPFCDLVVLLFILPYTTNKQQVRKPVLIALTISVIELLIVVLRDAVVLGPRMLISSAASFAVSRQIDIANVLTRLDILVAITLLITIFMKVTIFYYVTVLGIAQAFKLHSYTPLIIPIGALAIAIAANLYPSDMEQIYAGQYIWPFHATTNELILPIITMIVILLRRLPKKEGEKSK